MTQSASSAGLESTRGSASRQRSPTRSVRAIAKRSKITWPFGSRASAEASAKHASRSVASRPPSGRSAPRIVHASASSSYDSRPASVSIASARCSARSAPDASRPRRTSSRSASWRTEDSSARIRSDLRAASRGFRASCSTRRSAASDALVAYRLTSGEVWVSVEPASSGSVGSARVSADDAVWTI